MRFLCRELADGALLAFLLKTAFSKELRSELLLYSDDKTNGHTGDIQFASDRHWTLFRSKSRIVPTSNGQPFPYISSLIFILTQTHFSNKQSTLITIVPAASDFGFLSGSAPSASPESQTQYHFLHHTPPALLRFSSSKSSFTFDFPFKKFTIYFAPSSVRLFPTSHSPLSITRQIQHADRTRRFAQRQQHRQHPLLHDIVLYPSLHSAILPAMSNSCSFGSAFFCSTARRCLHPSASRHIPLMTRRRSKGARPLSSPARSPSSMFVE